jgi:hypothetical protein
MLGPFGAPSRTFKVHAMSCVFDTLALNPLFIAHKAMVARRVLYPPGQ